MTCREQLIYHIREEYNAEPEYLWDSDPACAVFRHKDNRKWFGIVMKVRRSTLGLKGDGAVDILNVKLSDPFFIDALVKREGFLRGYHMSHIHWITILLDGTVGVEEICDLLAESFVTTASSFKKQKLRAPKEWLIPANPKCCDVTHMFDKTDETDWKQGGGIIVGDTVYMYVAAPVSAILYKCVVTRINIPFPYDGGKVRMKALMKIKLLKRYDPDRFTFSTLSSEYGIYAIRGPRGVPYSLAAALDPADL